MPATSTDQQIVQLLQKQLNQLEKLNKGHKQQTQQSRSDFAALRLLMAWILFLVAYLYPNLAKLATNPAGSLLGTSGETDALYSEPVEEGDNIGGFTVSSGYGLRTAPTEGASTDHKGVDLLTPEGTQLAMIGAGKGTVECQEQQGGGGIYATITPSGIPYTFVAMHLSKCDSGTYEAGQIWGLTGNTGNSTGPHLHWEQHEGSNPIQPTKGFLWWAILGSPPKPYGVEAMTGFNDVSDMYSRIITQESGGDPSIINPDSGAIGIGQVMPENVASWTEQCLGKTLSPDQFAADATAQEQTVNCKLQEYWQQAKSTGESDFDSCRSVAAAWYSGDASLKDSDAPQSGYPSIKAYTESVCNGL